MAVEEAVVFEGAKPEDAGGLGLGIAEMYMRLSGEVCKVCNVCNPGIFHGTQPEDAGGLGLSILSSCHSKYSPMRLSGEVCKYVTYVTYVSWVSSYRILMSLKLLTRRSNTRGACNSSAAMYTQEPHR